MRARKLNRWLLALQTIAACFATAVSTASAHHPSVTGPYGAPRRH